MPNPKVELSDVITELNKGYSSTNNGAKILKTIEKETDPRHAMFAVYKMMLKKNDADTAMIIWNKLLESGMQIPYQPLLMDLISYGYYVDAFGKAIESMLKSDKENIVNQQNEEGTTPLMAAAQHGNVTVAKLLIQYGAQREMTNAKGETAADIALAKEQATDVTESKRDYQAIYKMVKPS